MEENFILCEPIALPVPPDCLFSSIARLDSSALLQSQMPLGDVGRYSFAAANPFLRLRTRGTDIEIHTGLRTIRRTGDPFEELKALLSRYRTPPGPSTVPFQGGAVGYLSYDLGRRIERLPETARDDTGLPEMDLHFYDSVFAYDHLKGEAFVFSSGRSRTVGPSRLRHAQARVDWWNDQIARACEETPFPAAPEEAGDGFDCPDLRSNFTRESYLRAVRRAREYIIEGDIFQVNLSQRFEIPFDAPAHKLYQLLSRSNPAPFAAFLNFPGVRIVSSSPERYLKVSRSTCEIRPIKGTRPRGATPEEDRRLARALCASAKDRAENTMIVDLVRNDLGRVCRFGTVRVEELTALETYPTVHHLTSTVRGELSPSFTAVDAVRASFPDGSITGAPKVRSMEIIEELEGVRRNVYTGAIGYFGFSDNADLNVAIRTITVKDGRATFGVGGGIVFDSDPEEEYEETLDKGRALARALVSLSPAPAAGREG